MINLNNLMIGSYIQLKDDNIKKVTHVYKYNHNYFVIVIEEHAPLPMIYTSTGQYYVRYRDKYDIKHIIRILGTQNDKPQQAKAWYVRKNRK